MTDILSGALYLRVVLALVGILAVLALGTMLARRFGLAARLGAAGKRRLGIVEAAAIDGKRRLLLLRRDEVEHLVLIGPEGATVVETGIRRRLALGAAAEAEPEAVSS
ncbi:MAG: flagellar biosynthetic protein FliO [Alphaproteobacteria bacterium]|nr:flagellar biosynthetic protein FliO [Alphaproteobacteria bacterium]